MNYLLYKKEFPVFCDCFFQWLKKQDNIDYYNYFWILLKKFINTYVGEYGYNDILDPKTLKNEKYFEIFKKNYKDYLGGYYKDNNLDNLEVESIHIFLCNEKDIFNFLKVLELILKIDRND